jgi:hypothetical protein
MNRLKWWFRIVGLFYFILGVGFFPPINEARLPFMIEIDVATSTVIYTSLIDWMFAFGLDMLVIGGFLLFASREPKKYIPVAWLIVWLEGIRGVLGDIYYLSRGIYSVPFFIGFIIVHLIIMGTGVSFIRGIQSEAASQER